MLHRWISADWQIIMMNIYLWYNMTTVAIITSLVLLFASIFLAHMTLFSKGGNVLCGCYFSIQVFIKGRMTEWMSHVLINYCCLDMFIYLYILLVRLFGIGVDVFCNVCSFVNTENMEKTFWRRLYMRKTTQDTFHMIYTIDHINGALSLYRAIIF